MKRDFSGLVAVVVPAHNEEEVIGESLLGVMGAVGRENVYVVNDGSSDETRRTSEEMVGKNVLSLEGAGGKANAIESGVREFALVKRYKYIMPIDADSVIEESFMDKIMERFEEDGDGQLACVTGRIRGRNSNWVSAYRLWEYDVGQAIHKFAQSVMGAIVVCAGPATVYRSYVFGRLGYPRGTQTEDMDLTFSIHRKKLGKIGYCSSATVTTQDPMTLKELMKQLNRWYSGFWQCVVKHRVPWGNQVLDVEVSLLALEGLFNGILVAALVLLWPWALLINPAIIWFPLAVDFGLFMLPSLVWVAVRNREPGILIYLPGFYGLRIFSSLMFLKSFAVVVMGLDLRVGRVWSMARYQTSGVS